MNSRIVLSAGFAATTCAAAIVDAAVAVSAGHRSSLFYVSEIGVAATWSLVGLAAQARRRDLRTGRLMQVMGAVLMINAPAGFALASSSAWVGADVLVARAVTSFQITVLAHLLLAYPSGRLRSAGERWLLGICHGYAAVCGAIEVADVVALTGRCGWTCAVAAGDRADAGSAVAINLGWWVLTIAYVWFLVARIRRATRRERRVLAYPLVMAVILALLFLVSVAFSMTTTRPLLGANRLLTLALEYVSLLAMPGAMLVGLVRERSSYASVAELVRMIDHTPVGQLQAALRRALTDASLVLAFPQGDRYVDEQGVEIPVSAGPRRRVLPIGGDPPVALVLHDSSLVDEPDLLSSAAAATRLALENSRLHAMLQAQLVEVRASRRRIVEAGTEQRRRLERDLHDGAQQRLLATKLALQLIDRDLPQQPERAAQAAQEAQRELQAAIDELRELARGIHPAVLTEVGLVAAVHSIAARSTLPVTVTADLPGPLPSAVEAAAYFIINESLANVIKHSGASRATVRLGIAGRDLCVEISDDGNGGADPGRGSGLHGLQDRAAAVGGSLQITSAPGAGTQLVARLPCDS